MRRLAAATHRSKLRKSMGTLLSVERPRACRTGCHSRSLGSSCSCSHRRRRSHSDRRLQLSKSAHRPCSSVSWRTPLARAAVGHPSRLLLRGREQYGLRPPLLAYPGRRAVLCRVRVPTRPPHRVPLSVSVSPSLSLSGRRSTTSPTRCVLSASLSLTHSLPQIWATALPTRYTGSPSLPSGNGDPLCDAAAPSSCPPPLSLSLLALSVYRVGYCVACDCADVYRPGDSMCFCM